MASKSASNDKTMAILSYFLFFIPLLTGNKSSFVMFHANQSLILLIAWVAMNVLSSVVPLLGSMVGMIVSIALFVLWIMGVLQAANGGTKPLPVIGGIKLLK